MMHSKSKHIASYQWFMLLINDLFGTYLNNLLADW